jgi:GNAT superfamily N-acetyltransferase
VTSAASPGMGLAVRPVTGERWSDLESFFGPRGAYANCWCTWWRQTSPMFSAGCRNHGEGNRAMLRRLTDEGRVPGLLAYAEGEPVGWVSVAPLTEFGRVLRSPNLKPEPGASMEGVWAVVCFWIPRQHRRQGIGVALLAAAADYARSQGAAAVEGYPIDTGGERVSSADLFTGALEMFERAGFREVRRRSPKRPVFRLDLSEPEGRPSD